jgi:predicted esterase
LADDASTGPGQRLALAISGWLVGTNSASENLPVALSLYRVRNLIHDYLGTADALGRTRIFEQFRSEEGATVPLAARLVALMKPPLPLPEPDSQKPGFLELEVPGLDPAVPVSYLVQLPPEYDPRRQYPTIVALHAADGDASGQLEWWAPQASRQGYIVVAPRWAAEHQKDYGYTAREHAAVLYTLRDAFRRLAIDTDRVFLTGYSQGGDAAWDLALAHPDLWAGVITVAARSDRYCTYYWETALQVPFYVVGGEKDGRWMIDNARDLDRYLQHGYNTTVVEFQGRGHERFSDEILRIFDWMGRMKRDFFPREFNVKSMRPWDNFFWWVELRGLPTRSMTDPLDWPGRSPRPAITDAKITEANTIRVKSAAQKTIVWLTPEVLDFDKPAEVTVNGRRLDFPSPPDVEKKSPSDGRPAASRARFPEPDLQTLLEDVRTRADRQHPFWAKVEN